MTLHGKPTNILHSSGMLGDLQIDVLFKYVVQLKHTLKFVRFFRNNKFFVLMIEIFLEMLKYYYLSSPHRCLSYPNMCHYAVKHWSSWTGIAFYLKEGHTNLLRFNNITSIE